MNADDYRTVLDTINMAGKALLERFEQLESDNREIRKELADHKRLIAKLERSRGSVLDETLALPKLSDR